MGVTLIAIVLTLLVSVTVGCLLAAWRIRRRVHQRALGTPLPKGARPSVRLEYGGVIYDVTDTLERWPDDEEGWAVWVVHGPLHLRMADTPSIAIEMPVPENTRLKLDLIGPPSDMRFATPTEIDEQRPSQ